MKNSRINQETINIIKSTDAFNNLSESTKRVILSPMAVELCKSAFLWKGIISYVQWKEESAAGSAVRNIVKEYFLR